MGLGRSTSSSAAAGADARHTRSEERQARRMDTSIRAGSTPARPPMQPPSLSGGRPEGSTDDVSLAGDVLVRVIRSRAARRLLRLSGRELEVARIIGDRRLRIGRLARRIGWACRPGPSERVRSPVARKRPSAAAARKPGRRGGRVSRYSPAHGNSGAARTGSGGRQAGGARPAARGGGGRFPRRPFAPFAAERTWPAPDDGRDDDHRRDGGTPAPDDIPLAQRSPRS